MKEDEIPVRRVSQSNNELRPTPPTPPKVMSEFKAVSSSQSSLRSRPVDFQSPRAASDPPPQPRAVEPSDDSGSLMPAADKLDMNLPPAAPTKPAAGKGNIFKRYWRHKLWTLPLSLLVIIGAFLAVPTTRYMALAYFVSRQFTVTVTDSTTDTPVSGATIKIDGRSALTDSAGQARIIVPVGQGKLSVSKAYYQSLLARAIFVDLATSADSLTVHLVATGRQVPLKVVNKITGKAIPEAQLNIGVTTARTDLNGQATVVLPTDGSASSVTIVADGYMNLTAPVQVTSKVVSANTFAMVPNGRIYFLSNQSGTIDVVSTNLDGSSRKTILAGTGSEDKNNTVLLASRDWKYLALLSKRDGGSFAKLYLINTSDNSLTTIDSSVANLTLVGWSGHLFIYTIQRPDVSSWLPNQQSIISYNADTKTAKTLVNSKAMGTNNADAQYQDLVYAVLFGDNVIYTTTWYKYPGEAVVAGQTDTMVSVQPDGSGSHTLKSVDAGTSYIDSVNLAGPDALYFAVYSTTPNYYRLDTNGSITQSSTITESTVTQQYPTYLQSPSGINTFWTSLRDGKNTLFVGDSNGDNANQVASASDYSPYGWFTDNYLLVEKNSSELYIMPVSGGTPLKISDYFKPDYAIYGYGGGYGGL